MTDDLKNSNNGNWTKWSMYVLKELEDLNQRCEKFRDNMQDMDKRLSMLQAKATLLGALGGSIIGTIISIIINKYL